jgi:drug/metabolite transporter (DMT)-like permease
MAVSWRVQFVLLAAVWGSSFLCIKVLDRHWPPADVALGRVTLGAVFLVVMGALRHVVRPAERGRAAWPFPRGAVWGHLAVVAVLMNAAPFTLFAFGETRISSVAAGLWNATTPLTTLLVLLTAIPEERLGRRRIAGLLAGFAGVALLLGPWRGLGEGKWLGHLACLGAAFCYGMAIPYTRRFLSGRRESGLSIAAAQLTCATAILLALAPLSGVPSRQLSAGALASLLVLGLLGSGLAFVLMHGIVRAAGPSTFSTVTYAVPVVSTALGVLVLGEPLSWNEPAGAVVVLAAMWWASERSHRLPIIGSRAARLPLNGQAAAPDEGGAAQPTGGDATPRESLRRGAGSRDAL